MKSAEERWEQVKNRTGDRSHEDAWIRRDNFERELRAATREALEEAARICDDVHERWRVTYTSHTSTAAEAANRIRAAIQEMEPDPNGPLMAAEHAERIAPPLDEARVREIVREEINRDALDTDANPITRKLYVMSLINDALATLRVSPGGEEKRT